MRRRRESLLLRPLLFALLTAVPAAGALAQGQTTPQIGFYTVTPCRVADTRNPTGPYGGPALAANSNRTFTVAGQCGVPVGAESVVLNVTVTQATAGGDLRIYPGGAMPSASAINYPAGKTRANNGSYALNSAGQLVLHSDQASGTVQVILDVAGYFEGQAPTGGGAVWSRRFGNTGDDRGQAMAVDGQGRVAVTGSFIGTTDFGGGSVSSFVCCGGSTSTIDIFIAEYSASGGYLWSRAIGSDSDEAGRGIAMDVSGNVLVTGYQGSYSVDYGGGPQFTHTGNDIFIAKYSSTGSWVWSKTIGGTGYEQGNAIAADGSGNVFVTGYIGTGAVDFGGGPLVSAGLSDVFLAKYSAAGQFLWAKRFGGNGNDTGLAVSTDGSGNVIIIGTFENTVDFGGGGLTSAGLRDVFVAKYSATGQHVWSKRFGSTGDEVGYGLAVDSAGDVVLSGKFQGSVSFGGTALTSAGGDDIFLVKLAGGTGNHTWSKRFGSTSGDVSLGVAVDAARNVVMTGYFTGSVDFGGGPLSTSGLDVFVAKYNSAGTHMWSRRYGGFDTQIGNAVAMAATGEVSVTGYFATSIDFGTGTLTSAGSYDGFIASIGP